MRSIPVTLISAPSITVDRCTPGQGVLAHDNPRILTARLV